MESEDFKGKTIIPFATSGMSPIGESGKNLQEIAKDAKVFAGKRFDKNATEEELKKFAQEY